MGVHDSIGGYRLARKDFYLPYQRLVEEGVSVPTPSATKPSSPDVEWSLDDMGVVLQSLRVAENIPGFPLRPQLRYGGEAVVVEPPLYRELVSEAAMRMTEGRTG